MPVTSSDFWPWFRPNALLLLPLLLSLWMAWGDLKTRRIPNYLTLGTALAGLGFQAALHGWGGLLAGFQGLALGFGLLIIPYLLHGMGAGDVKALAALGAWLGPRLTLGLFVYMGICGGLLILGLLAWQGALGSQSARAWQYLRKRLFYQDTDTAPPASPPPKQRVPYAVALALGMALLYWRPPF
jgi:prepilin peptidase CpaA